MKQPDFVTISNGEDVQSFDNWTEAQDSIWGLVMGNREVLFRMKRADEHDRSHLWIEVA